MRNDRSTFRYLDLSGMLFSGLVIGYERQRIADSGELIPDKIFISMLIATGTFLLAFLLLYGWLRQRKVPVWIVRALVGSTLCSLGLNVVYYVLSNQRYAEGRSLGQYVWWLLPDLTVSFLAAFLLYAVFSLSVLAIIRLLARGVVSLRDA